MTTWQSHPPQNLTLGEHGACCWKKLRQRSPRVGGPLLGGSSMPGVGTKVGSQTGRRSQTAGTAGIILFSVAVGVMALFTLLLAVSDARSRAERQAETQTAANAAAAGAVADLPKGTAAVLRSAGRILGSQKVEGLPGRFGAQAIQVGHWDAGRPVVRDRRGSAECRASHGPIERRADSVRPVPGEPNRIADRSQRPSPCWIPRVIRSSPQSPRRLPPLADRPFCPARRKSRRRLHTRT